MPILDAGRFVETPSRDPKFFVRRQESRGNRNNKGIGVRWRSQRHVKCIGGVITVHGPRVECQSRIVDSLRQYMRPFKYLTRLRAISRWIISLGRADNPVTLESLRGQLGESLVLDQPDNGRTKRRMSLSVF